MTEQSLPMPGRTAAKLATAAMLAAAMSAAPLAGAWADAAGAGRSASAATTTEGDDALVDLLNAARDGSGDAHLPYVLVRLKRALGEQDVIAFLDLVDPKFFAEQFGALADPKRSPGEAMAQFTCEFISVCDIAKSYKFTDVVSMRLVSVGRMDAPLDQPVDVTIELRMWDGVLVQSVIHYDRRTFRLSAARG